jgi:hypothetical protein
VSEFYHSKTILKLSSRGMHFCSPTLHLTAFSQQEGQIGHPILGIFWVILAFLTTNPCYHSPKFFSVLWQLLGGMDFMVLLPRSQASLTFCPHDLVVCSRFSNTSHGLVDLGTVGTFPHACLDLALDFCGQPLAWIDCLSNISHARGAITRFGMEPTPFASLGTVLLAWNLDLGK